MRKKLSKSSIPVLACALLFGSAAGNAAESFDGSSNIICAAIDVVGCVDGAKCLKGQARTFELPEFMTVDFKKKVVHVSYDGGTKEAESPIKNHETTGTQLILQGVENGHGWSMAIHRSTGRMTTAAVGEDLSFSIFGVCKAI
jgi:hypothetical protein